MAFKRIHRCGIKKVSKELISPANQPKLHYQPLDHHLTKMQSIFESSWLTALYPFLLFASVAGGYFFARNRYYKKQRIWKPSGTENAIIGFYGLLLSFTLLSSGNANRERNNLVHQHADALSAIFRESELSDDSVKRGFVDRITEILSMKVMSDNNIMNRDTTNDMQTDSLYNKLIQDVKRMGRMQLLNASESRFYMDKIHTAIALDYRIQYSELERTPITIMVLLIIGSLLIGILIGFTNGFNEEHHFLIPFIFLILTSLTIVTIRDLDNPAVGLIRPSYKNYENMLRDIKQ